MWGPNTSETPAVLNFSDREDAITKFIDIAKTVEGGDKQPPPMEEVVIDERTRFFRIISATHKYILVYCNNHCSEGKDKSYRPVLN